MVYYIHSDHPSALLRTGLGSTGLLSDQAGHQVPGSVVRYLPYGGVRLGEASTLPTEYTFTGQRWEAGLGLMHYGARYYSPRLGRFVSADSIVPNPLSPQDFNRYSYASNNPLRYRDPTGHYIFEDDPRRPYFSPPTHPVVEFMCQKMLANAQSDIAQAILVANSVDQSFKTFQKSSSLFSLMPPITSGAIKTAGDLGWASMVRQGGPWDPKPDIIDEFGDPEGYSALLDDGYYYYYDVWGNVMYGYLGAATGFSESELFEGAGAEQIGSDTGYAVKYKDPSSLPHVRIPEAEGFFAAFDHPADRVGTQIGIELWNAYRLDLTSEALQQAVLERGELLERQRKPY